MHSKSSSSCLTRSAAAGRTRPHGSFRIASRPRSDCSVLVRLLRVGVHFEPTWNQLRMRSVDRLDDVRKDSAHHKPRGATIGLKLIVRPRVSDQTNRLIQLAADIPHKSLDLCCNFSVRDHVRQFPSELTRPLRRAKRALSEFFRTATPGRVPLQRVC